MRSLLRTGSRCWSIWAREHPVFDLLLARSDGSLNPGWGFVILVAGLIVALRDVSQAQS
jgi:hypothetical protein